MQRERSGLEESLLSELQCPVCMEYMVPPIILCVNGHNICEICSSKITACPTCRDRILGTRGLSLEKLAREVNYPCSYQMLGCEEVFVHDMVREHQHRCRYRPLQCPVPDTTEFVQCPWTGRYDDIEKHLMGEHLEYCYGHVTREFRVLECSVGDIFLSKFVFALNEVFFLTLHTENDMFYAVLRYIGPPDRAAKYKYKVKFVNTDNTEGVTVLHLARSFDEKLDDILNSGNCGNLHNDVVRRLIDEEGNLKFKFEILSVGD